MEDNRKEKEDDKPFIPGAPGTESREKKTDGPNPESDPNYAYYPNMAYPTGPDKEEGEENNIKSEKKK